MKVRELHYSGFRGVGEAAREVRFFDELTGEVRPLTVLVGSNGCGKTTVLELLHGLLTEATQVVFTSSDGTHTAGPRDTLLPRTQGIHAGAALEFGEDGPSAFDGAAIWIGESSRADPHSQGRRSMTDPLTVDYVDGTTGTLSVREILESWADAVEDGVLSFTGGLIHFPHNRWIEHRQAGSIEPPPEVRSWIYRFDPSGDGWKGSLAQQWVWQNYLDLEAGAEGRPNLAPFVEVVEEILGEGQRVRIRQGRVSIERPRQGDSVEPHQLPSGQQQILTLFGELARRLRPGAIVLIDEIELSLHPALQRAVIHHLRRLAAKYDLQVVVTTHSMEIVSAVAPNEVVNLDDMALQERATPEEASG